eukprot:COSAG01_NODE_12876_length_1671_cov_4.799618_1_plen_158_part_00
MTKLGDMFHSPPLRTASTSVDHASRKLLVDQALCRLVLLLSADPRCRELPTVVPTSRYGVRVHSTRRTLLDLPLEAYGCCIQASHGASLPSSGRLEECFSSYQLPSRQNGAYGGFGRHGDTSVARFHDVEHGRTEVGVRHTLGWRGWRDASIVLDRI